MQYRKRISQSGPEVSQLTDHFTEAITHNSHYQFLPKPGMGKKMFKIIFYATTQTLSAAYILKALSKY